MVFEDTSIDPLENMIGNTIERLKGYVRPAVR